MIVKLTWLHDLKKTVKGRDRSHCQIDLCPNRWRERESEREREREGDRGGRERGKR